MTDGKQDEPVKPETVSLPDTDRPITADEEDRFGRTRLADSIATDVGSGTGSLVAAVTGPWGSGKTSVLQLVQARLAKNESVVPIHFNPWLFAGTDQLIQAFFGELVAQLSSSKDENIRAAAKRVQEYSELLDPFGELPGIGGPFKAGGRGLRLLASKLAGRTKFHATSVDEQKAQIEAALAATNKRFVVFIDDIDRLEQGEVRDVVRLVRLVADFPRISYLLAFDRKRVEAALGGGDAEMGRDYLEKIVQLSYPGNRSARRDRPLPPTDLDRYSGRVQAPSGQLLADAVRVRDRRG
jgi:predicted KAP-like P-loop ATPase